MPRKRSAEYKSTALDERWESILPRIVSLEHANRILMVYAVIVVQDINIHPIHEPECPGTGHCEGSSQ